MQAQTTLHGVMGVVSQIFKPMMNYESAIGSALGGALYHIVTEDETSARHAITFLKKNQSGRATFLPMNVLKPRYIGRDHRMLCENSVGFLGSAAEFVENEPIFDPVRDALLGNVIVCDNLMNANELAKRLKYGYKIITLDGDIVHRGGSMTGGKQKDNHSPMQVQKEYNQILQRCRGSR